jgi:hypothetical protein
MTATKPTVTTYRDDRHKRPYAVTYRDGATVTTERVATQAQQKALAARWRKSGPLAPVPPIDAVPELMDVLEQSMKEVRHGRGSDR